MDDVQYDIDTGLHFRLCDVCSKRIEHKYKSQIKQKTCSHSCQIKGNKYRIGKKPTNAFKIGETAGSNNINWKAENASYGAKHDWASRHWGKPQLCQHCSAENLGSRKHQWANISGKYKRDRSDWLRLCAKCHFKFDGREKYMNRKGYMKPKVQS
jgi:hypothetical protein